MDELLIITPTQLNLGTLPVNTVKEFEYEIRNNTGQPLILTPWASCGCTTPSVIPTLIGIDEVGKLIGRFDTLGRSGLQEKSLGVTYTLDGSTTKTASVKFIAKI